MVKSCCLSVLHQAKHHPDMLQTALVRDNRTKREQKCVFFIFNLAINDISPTSLSQNECCARHSSIRIKYSFTSFRYCALFFLEQDFFCFFFCYRCCLMSMSCRAALHGIFSVKETKKKLIIGGPDLSNANNKFL